MKAAVVDITTFSDADFSMSFRWRLTDNPETWFDFTGYKLILQVRKTADDEEVFVDLSSDNISEIDLYASDGEAALTHFDINVSRAQMADMFPGEYVHSLIMVRSDDLREDIWRGKWLHDIGPTRPTI